MCIGDCQAENLWKAINEKRKEHRSEHLSIVQSGALFLLRLDAE